MRRPVRWVGALGLVAVAVLVGRAESAPAGRGPARVDDFDMEIESGPVDGETAGAVGRAANGNFTAREKATIKFGTQSPHKVLGVIDDEPVAKGGRLSASITDEDLGQTTTFTYDPAANSITFARGTDQVVIVQNPDHSYRVGGKPAANGKAVVAMLRSVPVYAETSPHSVLLAYGFAQRPSLETRVPCSAASTNTGGWPATPPAVCEMFKDVCDCIACDKAGKKDCKRCP